MRVTIIALVGLVESITLGVWSLGLFSVLPGWSVAILGFAGSLLYGSLLALTKSESGLRVLRGVYVASALASSAGIILAVVGSNGDVGFFLALICSAVLVQSLWFAFMLSGEAGKDLGNTELHEVSAQGQERMAKILIENGADVNARNRSGMTPLHCAASACHKNLVALLIANRADATAKDRDGNTPLDLVPKEHDHIRELLGVKGEEKSSNGNDQ